MSNDIVSCDKNIKIGICSAPLVELWGVYYGLCIAWNRGFWRLEVEVDSESVVSFFRTEIHDSHVYRKANYLADGLVNYVFLYRLVYIILSLFRSLLVLFCWKILRRCPELGKFACSWCFLIE